MANPNPLTHRAHRGLLGVVKPKIACFGSSCVMFAYGMLWSAGAFAESGEPAPKPESHQVIKAGDEAPSHEPNLRSKQAAQHGEQLKGDGDQLAADRYADAASRWQRVAAAREKAARIAKEAARLERATTELNDQTRRARTLVEQTEARRARALGELRRLGVEAIPTNTTHK